jgi:serine protease Do
MPQDKQLQKILIIVVFLSLLVGWTSGVLGGMYGKSHIIPWFEKNFLGKAATLAQPTLAGREILRAVEEESATIAAVKKVSPSVVSIVISKDLSKMYNLTGPDVFSFPDFFEFGFPFGFKFNAPESESPKTPEGESQKQTIGGGTGFIISEDGLILTNKHVVSDTEAEYTVITSDDKKYGAKIIATDPFLDIAVLKIEASGLPTVELGDSEKLELGQTVIAIGYSLGEYQNTVTKGVISGMGRRIVAGDQRGDSEIIEQAIQTDAAINPGNSGGPLVNLAGQVIGINTAINQEGQLIGFAIPINAAKQAIESVKQNGKIVRPWLGVRYVLLNEEIAEANRLEVNYGALIVRGKAENELAVVPGSPADAAGLVENDIILELAGQKIDEENPLAREIGKFKPGDEITLKILRKGEEKTLRATLAEFKE